MTRLSAELAANMREFLDGPKRGAGYKPPEKSLADIFKEAIGEDLVVKENPPKPLWEQLVELSRDGLPRAPKEITKAGPSDALLDRWKAARAAGPQNSLTDAFWRTLGVD